MQKNSANLFGWTDEQIAEIVKLQNHFKDHVLCDAVSNFLLGCEKDGVPCIYAMTAIAAELLYLAAHLHLEASGTPESFRAMATSAIEGATQHEAPTEH